MNAHAITSKTEREMSWTAKGVTYKLSLDGHELYILLADDGQGGCTDVAVRASKLGSTMYGSLATLTRQVTGALESGRPLVDIVAELRGMIYEPRGFVHGHPRIELAESFADLLAQVLADRYLRSPPTEK